MQKRRHFLKSIIRGSLFASFGLLTGVLLYRREGNAACRPDFACGNCSFEKGCRLPEADSYRLEKAKLQFKNAENGPTGK